MYIYFIFKLFCLFLAFKYVATESTDADRHIEFAFHTLTLGNSGALISWKPITVPHGKSISNYRFRFGIRNLKEKFPTALQFSENVKSDYKQHKIHSLNENSTYEIVIQQYYSYTPGALYASSLKKAYSVRVQTNFKTNAKPAKPHFELTFNSAYVRIRWLPCGKERNCHDEEAGTHFGIKIRPIDTLGEARNEEYRRDYQEIIFWPARIYEIVVYSVNGESKTDSDPQEIFIDPWSSPVQYVKIISMPDSSVYIRWEEPKYTVEDLPVKNYFVLYSNLRQGSCDIRNQFHLMDNGRRIVTKLYVSETMQMIIRNITPGVEYTYSIIPYFESTRIGFEYQVKHTLHLYKDELQIAKPDFTIKSSTRDEKNCGLLFSWLPCGHSWDCKNSKPGLKYSIVTKPEAFFEYPRSDDDVRSWRGTFNVHREYEVTLKSQIGNASSESQTKMLKNCYLYGNKN